MSDPYFDMNQSAAISTSRVDSSILNLVAGRFIGNHPPLPFQPKIDFENGILCDTQGRYQFDFGCRFPNTPVGNYCTAVGNLFSFSDRNSIFTISCIGPTTCLVNGEVCYRSSPKEEGMHKECQFSVSLHAGYNTFTFLTEKTVLGFGFLFGNSAPQWEPYLFSSPLPERTGQLGFIYTPPLPLDRAQTASVNLHEFSWFPLLGEQPNEASKHLLPEKVFGEAWHGFSFAVRQIRVDSYSKLTFSIEHEPVSDTGREIMVYTLPANKKWTTEPTPSAVLNDTQTSMTIELKRGLYLFIIRIHRPLGKYHTSVTFQIDSGEIYNISHIHGYHDTWLYLGSFHHTLPALSSLLELNQVFQDGEQSIYWQACYPHSVVRMCVENELFGRWTYPMGVTLYGILKAGEYLNRPDYMEYARKDVTQITSFHKYALFDKKRFGFPSLNQQISWLTELDDCGSFGSLMLECKKYWDIPDSDALADTIANHMRYRQKRLPDGVFCRHDGTMWIDDLFMSIPFLVRYYQLSQDSYYLDEACKQLLLFRQYFYMTDKHLMSHIYDLKWQKANRIPWSRGNGWVMFSMSELLEVLPRTHKDREEIIQFFHDMADGILNTQGAHGLWHQVLDDPTTYDESSSTAMFICAFARSIRKGYARERFLPALRKSIQRAWDGLTSYAIDCHGNVYGVCQGSGCSFSREYYRQLSWRFNDAHGIGIVLLAGVEKCLLDES